MKYFFIYFFFIELCIFPFTVSKKTKNWAVEGGAGGRYKSVTVRSRSSPHGLHSEVWEADQAGLASLASPPYPSRARTDVAIIQVQPTTRLVARTVLTQLAGCY